MPVAGARRSRRRRHGDAGLSTARRRQPVVHLAVRRRAARLQLLRLSGRHRPANAAGLYLVLVTHGYQVAYYTYDTLAMPPSRWCTPACAPPTHNCVRQDTPV